MKSFHELTGLSVPSPSYIMSNAFWTDPVHRKRVLGKCIEKEEWRDAKWGLNSYMYSCNFG